MFKLREKGKSDDVVFSIMLSTRDEFERRNIFNITIFGRYWYYDVPQFLKPFIKDGSFANNGVTTHYTVRVEKKIWCPLDKR